MSVKWLWHSLYNRSKSTQKSHKSTSKIYFLFRIKVKFWILEKKKNLVQKKVYFRSILLWFLSYFWYFGMYFFLIFFENHFVLFSKIQNLTLVQQKVYFRGTYLWFLSYFWYFGMYFFFLHFLKKTFFF